MKKDEVTEAMKHCMAEADRDALFGIGRSLGHLPSYDSEKDTIPPEVVEQRNFAKACKDRGWRAVWHKTNKRSTANVGCPDFIVGAYATTWWMEFKKPGEELRPDQAAFKKQLKQNGIEMYVVHSAAEAVAIIERNHV